MQRFNPGEQVFLARPERCDLGVVLRRPEFLEPIDLALQVAAFAFVPEALERLHTVVRRGRGAGAGADAPNEQDLTST
jgi:hypothetical protein